MFFKLLLLMLLLLINSSFQFFPMGFKIRFLPVALFFIVFLPSFLNCVRNAVKIGYKSGYKSVEKGYIMQILSHLSLVLFCIFVIFCKKVVFNFSLICFKIFTAWSLTFKKI